MTTRSPRGRWTRLVMFLVVVSVSLTGLVVAPSTASASSGIEGTLEQEFLAQLNAERAARGIAPMSSDGGLIGASRNWADSMAGRGGLVHSSDGRAEIIARGYGTGQITDAWMRSPSHRNLIVDPNLTVAGVGVQCDANGQMWAVVQFERADRSLGTLSSSSATPRITDPNSGHGCGSGVGTGSVERLYLAYFLRSADASGVNYWVGELQRGARLKTVSEAFAASSEFRQRYGNLSNADFVRLVYVNVLGRQPDASGLNYWTSMLNRGTPRGEVMIGFSESAEFMARTGIY
ncbi:MAG: DUF4214 domain-containing protein [Acidimicrobiales bacterium]